jgi:hypothetical protein
MVMPDVVLPDGASESAHQHIAAAVPGSSDLVVRRDLVTVPAAGAAELALNPWWLPVGVAVAGELPRLAHRASLGPPRACTRHHLPLIPVGKIPDSGAILHLIDSR